MTRIEVVTLDESERVSLLGDGGTGVLSFSTEGDEPPRTIPVSYGYDAVTSSFYFRLATSSEWPADEFDGHAVSFVTYDVDDGWWSIIAKGRLEDIEHEDIATESLDALERVEIPLIDIFGTHPREIDFSFCRLDPEECTGRHEASTSL
ncbi:pyridoxamine 5'-phosphate oxidase family protein [Halobacteria archaeon AArc-curdl1]|uniref:Pyridoxamine 5'-phosphate oxidase family protein n=1 Tax=Natronosalvus hydrolyticus TaxID=2979988 RepID=A0AAP2ZBB2_9EURY|nr:pyridoxamine 5'-phosphate oxidase family protein [Halobacteria archaeon AArc-curdl1]